MSRTVRNAVAGIVVLILMVGTLLIVRQVTSGSAGTSANPTVASTTRAQAPSTKGPKDPESGLAWIAVGELPAQARDTLALIDKGGPYPYPKNDDVTYRNLNGILPKQPMGYYREYTVPTPGSADRGARRIVLGRKGELYWTADHYDSFARIRR